MNPTISITRSAAIAAILAGASAAGTVQAADLSAVPSGTYVLDPTHAYIDFSYSHLGLSNPSLSFDDFTVDLNLDSEDPTKSMLLVTIDVASIQTGSGIFKEHLTGGDWFDATTYPEITFQSTSITADEDGGYSVVGELTIKDTSQPVTLDVTINAAMDHPMTGKPVIGVGGTGELLRSDFGLGKFAPNVSDEVQLSFTAEMTKEQ